MLLVWRGSVLGRILPQLCVTTVFAAAVVAVWAWRPDALPDLTPIPFTLLGIAVAIFLGFRNSVSYERYWEARKLWGSVLNDTRSIARQALSACDADLAARKSFVHVLIAFVHLLKAQLRLAVPDPSVAELLPKDAEPAVLNARFKPAAALVVLAEQLRRWRVSGDLSPILFASMDRHLSGLTDALGGCERIASTPIPFAYSVILHRTTYLYSFLLPFGLAHTVGIMTPVMVAFVSYTFFALEALAEELQDPFGTEPNDLPLDAITAMIEAALRETISEPAAPEAPVPASHIVT